MPESRKYDTLRKKYFFSFPGPESSLSGRPSPESSESGLPGSAGRQPAGRGHRYWEKRVAGWEKKVGWPRLRKKVTRGRKKSGRPRFWDWEKNTHRIFLKIYRISKSIIAVVFRYFLLRFDDLKKLLPSYAKSVLFLRVQILIKKQYFSFGL